MSLKMLKRALTLVLIVILLLYAQTLCQYQFNLETGKKYVYQIDIKLSQNTDLSSSSAHQSRGGEITLEGVLGMKYSLEVIENYDNDYAKIICRFDSLRADLRSVVDDTETILALEAFKDDIKIRVNDSLVAEHSPEILDGDGAGDFYERLLFVGEDIVMLVYPDGEIMNITENKNLWEQAMDFIGLADEGFLQIIFPRNISSGRWEQSSDIKKLGDFKLKIPPDPLITNYSLHGGTDKPEIRFTGILKLDRFMSETGVPDLDDQMTLEISNLSISKNGSALFSYRRGIIEKLSYETSLKGELYLSGSGLEEYQSGIDLDLTAVVTYSLID